MTHAYRVRGVNMFTRYVLLAGVLVGTLGHPSVPADTALTESELDDQRLNDRSGVVATDQGFFPLHVVKRTGWELYEDLYQHPCSTWNATIAITASYETKVVEADVKVLSEPNCTTYDASLWKMQPDYPEYEPCINGMRFITKEVYNFTTSITIATFQNVTPGNYCIRVTPCIFSSDSDGCVTLYSRVVELPETKPHEEAVVVRRKKEEGYYVLLLLPVIGILVFLGYKLYRRKKSTMNVLYANVTEKITSAKVMTNPPVPAPLLVIRVIYSRDSPQHIEAVAALCHFLEREVDVKVVYDGNAEAEAHLTSDWAIAMADVYCPVHSKQPPKADTIERILVIESEGALIKQDAHHNYKDVGLAATDCIDEMYHTTFTALVSKQAQALCDYCHIFVARFPYSAKVGRLNLVPEKRYDLPLHMRDLLKDMLHTKPPQGRIPALDRLDQILESEAYRQLLLVVDNAKNSLDENPNLIKDKFKTIITI